MCCPVSRIKDELALAESCHLKVDGLENARELAWSIMESKYIWACECRVSFVVDERFGAFAECVLAGVWGIGVCFS